MPLQLQGLKVHDAIGAGGAVVADELVKEAQKGLSAQVYSVITFLSSCEGQGSMSGSQPL